MALTVGIVAGLAEASIGRRNDFFLQRENGYLATFYGENKENVNNTSSGPLMYPPVSHIQLFIDDLTEIMCVCNYTGHRTRVSVTANSLESSILVKSSLVVYKNGGGGGE